MTTLRTRTLINRTNHNPKPSKIVMIFNEAIVLLVFVGISLFIYSALVMHPTISFLGLSLLFVYCWMCFHLFTGLVKRIFNL